MPNDNDPRIVITPMKPALILGVAQKLAVLVRGQHGESGRRKRLVVIALDVGEHEIRFEFSLGYGSA